MIPSELSVLRKKCPYSELFCPAFSGIRTEYGELQYSVRMQENAEQKNFKYGHFLRSAVYNVSISSRIISLRQILEAKWH